MKKALALTLLLAVVACSDVPSRSVLGPAPRAGGAMVAADVMVTNSNDAGAGSFRDAISRANSDVSIGSIGFDPNVTTIHLQSPLTYTGSQDLTINGNHATLDGSAAGGSALIVETDGADLEILRLTVRNAASEGIRVNVLSTATGVVRVRLAGVDVINNAGHGFLVNDQADPESSDPSGSAASVDVTVVDSRFLGNGYSVSDRDGIRINEGGAGDLTFTSRNSRCDDNAADGIELDERGAGDVIIDVVDTHITRNGRFDPADLDDGFDIDEAGDGSILGQVVSSSANHNFEEGLDFNENDAGDLRVDLTDVQANFNREEGVDYEEDDDFAGGGDLVAVMNRVTTIGNGVDGGDGGLKIREKGLGDLDVTLTNMISSQNSLAGIHVRETEGGDSRVRIAKAITTGNAGNGIEARESGAGNIVLATFTDITTSGNGGFGLSVDNGTASITNVKGGGNGSGLTGGGATFVSSP